MKSDWYKHWFDTSFYHILYQHRDDTDAQLFIDNLFTKLKPKKTDLILDLACGRGRHAIYMNKKGYKVIAYDLSAESIAYAQKFANPTLHFEVKDMRSPMGQEVFDWVFNLFTSFGYFDNDEDNQQALNCISSCLKPSGKVVIDFMNVYKVERKLVPEEVKTAGGIEFHIKRYTDEKHIIKEISFEADGRPWQFFERVKKLSVTDFEALFRNAGLQPLAYFGSHDLQPFHDEQSDRLIMIAQKIL